MVDRPLQGGLGGGLLPAGAVMITCDDRGVAERIVERFDMFDHPTILLRHVDGKNYEQSPAVDLIELDLSDAENVTALLSGIRKYHPVIGGLLHLSPISRFAGSDTLTQRARRDCRSLYLLARGLEADLNQASRDGKAILLTATAIDGRLGYGNDPECHVARAAHGGILGLTKCIGLEWPDVIVRAVDIDPKMSANAIFDAITAEMSEAESPLEVGVDATGRRTWEPISAPIRIDSDAAELLQPDDVVVITGGARGITAEIAIGMARKYRPRLILLGRSALPSNEELETVSAAKQESDIKAALIAHARKQGRVPKPAEIGRETKRILATREIRRTLDEIRRQGGSVEYQAVDVSDHARFASALREIQHQHGPIAGVIHGGVIEDKLLRDKTPESFDRVFNTKINSTATLIEVLDPGRLKFLALFASVASRFGNRGQSDYAAANEVLGKVACILNAAWPMTKTFAVAWGPWAEVGMVADLEKHLTAQG
ncbi:MAG: KR domain-containing protein [Pirellulaceae bacterium]